MSSLVVEGEEVEQAVALFPVCFSGVDVLLAVVSRVYSFQSLVSGWEIVPVKARKAR